MERMDDEDIYNAEMAARAADEVEPDMDNTAFDRGGRHYDELPF